jgi:hypothetical protein
MSYGYSGYPHLNTNYMGQEHSTRRKTSIEGVARSGSLVSRSSANYNPQMTQNANTNGFPPVAPVYSPPPYSPIDPSPSRPQSFNPFTQQQYASEPQPTADTSQGAYLDRRVSTQVNTSISLGSPHQRYASVSGYPQSPQSANPYAQAGSVARNNTVNSHRSQAYMPSSPITPVSPSARTQPATTPTAPSARNSLNRRASVEDPLLQLVKYDTIIIVSISSPFPIVFSA